MKIIVTKLGTKKGNGGEGRVDFIRNGEVIHQEMFSGYVESEYVRLVKRLPDDVSVEIVPVTGTFEARIEE